MSVRVIADGAWGFAASDNLSRAAVEATAAQAVEIARASARVKQRDVVLAPEKPVRPVLRQVVTNDVTTEKLAVILSNNPHGVIRLTDELAAFMRMMNLYHGGKGADRQFYLSAWSGSTAQVDRKSQDTPILVREPFVNVLGGIQPGPLGHYLRAAVSGSGKEDDGLISRFQLLVYPDSGGAWRNVDVAPDHAARCVRASDDSLPVFGTATATLSPAEGERAG